MRTSLSVSAAGAAAVALLLLAGCSSGGTTINATGSASTNCTVASSGSASDSVQVTGDLDTHPTATFSSPLSVDATQRSVVMQGNGDLATPGTTVVADVTIYNGSTGKEAYSTTTQGGAQQIDLDQQQTIAGLFKSLQCSTVGSRIAAVVPPSEAYGTQGLSQIGLSGTDTVVFIVDIKSIHHQLTTDQTKATGAPQPPQGGMPTVTLAADGTPTVTIPNAPAPTDLQTAVLKKGDGPTVADGQQVVLQYQGVNWSTGKVFDQSWGKSDGPVTFNPANTIKGFGQAIIGQTVGSQVLVVIPPALGYGSAGSPGAGIGGNDDLVFVIDILAAG